MSDLGRSLLKRRNIKTKFRAKPIHDGSITERNDLDEFLAVSELSHRKFEAENARFVKTGVTSSMPDTNLEDYKAWIRLPRRPKWDSLTSAEQLSIMEEESFLEWRRGIARLENSDKFVMTPFERNLEIWRQLWRVVELSDVIVQIVDARNPLFFLCEDLFSYCKELSPDKRFIILINKADLLSKEQILEWKDYFVNQKLDVFFFSAIQDEYNPQLLLSSDLVEALSFLGI